eukprot:92969-Chlamydomonas_euryale.AAC.1
MWMDGARRHACDACEGVTHHGAASALWGGFVRRAKLNSALPPLPFARAREKAALPPQPHSTPTQPFTPSVHTCAESDPTSSWSNSAMARTPVSSASALSPAHASASDWSAKYDMHRLSRRPTNTNSLLMPPSTPG